MTDDDRYISAGPHDNSLWGNVNHYFLWGLDIEFTKYSNPDICGKARIRSSLDERSDIRGMFAIPDVLLRVFNPECVRCDPG